MLKGIIGSNFSAVNQNVYVSEGVPPATDAALGLREAGVPGAASCGSKRLYLDTSVQSDHKEIRAELHKRLGRLGKGHGRALEMAKFIQVHDSRRSEKLRTCATWLAFRNYFTKQEPWKLSAGMFCCQHLLCPVCAQLRSGRTARKYLERAEIVLNDHPRARLSMLTITVKNEVDLAERYTHLMRCFGLWLKKSNRARNGQRHKTEFSKIAGGVASVEIKRGKNSGKWHPHIHALVLHDSKLDVELIRSEWKKMTGDSQNVDLMNIEGFKRGSDFDPVAVAGDFCEVFKYATKFSEMSLEDNWHAFGILSGKRLLRAWGLFWGVKVPDELTDDVYDDLPFIERIFKYSKQRAGYFESRTVAAQKGYNNVAPF